MRLDARQRNVAHHGTCAFDPPEFGPVGGPRSPLVGEGSAPGPHVAPPADLRAWIAKQ